MKKVILPLIILTILFLGYKFIPRTTIPKPIPTPILPTPTPELSFKVITGNIVCLPHKDTTGPQTLECAFGLKDQSGKYYSLINSKSELDQSRSVTVLAYFDPAPDTRYNIIGKLNVVQILSYIQPIDWPPVSTPSNQAFSCTTAGTPVARSGQTQSRTINGRTYCVSVVRQGAAGSIYYQYAYAIPWHNQTLIYTFSIRTPQCANYPDPQKSACEAEVSAFSPDTLIDSYIHSGTS